MSETTKAFVAGALVSTIAFALLWHNNYRGNQKQQTSTKKDISNKKRSASKTTHNNCNESLDEKTSSTCNGDDNDDSDFEDDDSSGQLSLDDEDNDDNTDQDNNKKRLCQSWGMKNVPYKMVLCVNVDLSMGKGKIAAQCCHAAVGCYKRSMKLCPSAVRAWEYTGCAKIAVKCPNADEIILIATKAKSLNIPFYLVEDAGRTQIAAGSKTVLSLFGPVNIFEGITDHLKLM
jgi:peptidyl-tRNA hydrolase, PTH2 family